MGGHYEVSFYAGNYKLAIERVINKYSPTIDAPVAAAPDALSSIGPQLQDVRVPLNERPLLMVTDIDPGQHGGRLAWLMLGVVFLCFCPCTGPCPLGVTMTYIAWAAEDDRYAGRHVVPNHDAHLFTEPLDNSPLNK